MTGIYLEIFLYIKSDKWYSAKKEKKNSLDRRALTKNSTWDVQFGFVALHN